MSNAKIGTAIALYFVCVLARPTPAQACSCAWGRPNEFLLRGESLPENARGVPWWFRSDSLSAASVTGELWDGVNYQPVPMEVLQDQGFLLIAPLEAWHDGERYRIQVEVDWPNGKAPELLATEIDIVSPLDPELDPVLLASESRQMEAQLVDYGGSCAANHAVAYSETEVTWPGASLGSPLNALFYRTYVDGVLWELSRGLCSVRRPGESWQGVATNRIVTSCRSLPYEFPDGETILFETNEDVSVGEGRHTVVVEARLPGTEISFRREVAIELRCPAPAIDPELPPLAPELDTDLALVPVPVAEEDSKSSVLDEPQGGVQDVSPNGININSSPEGCSLRPQDSNPSRSWWGYIVLAAMLGLTTRWRRRL